MNTPRLLASTAQAGPGNRQEVQKTNKRIDANFKCAQWTADGTSIITNSADNRVRTFIIPPDLLEDREEKLTLDSYSEIRFVEAVRASAPYPLFDLQNLATTLVLCSIPDHPIRLHLALSSELVASYPFVHATTERYISPHALSFTSDGQTFVTGSQNRIATFDASRPGEGPFSLVVTAQSPKMRQRGTSIGMKGIVSALSIEPASRVLAAGTFSRHVGLYSSNGQGECIGVFRVNQNQADTTIGGRGITQLIWSPSGHYLYIAERRSRGVMVYDIRKTGQLLSWAEGRNAETNQRLHMDVVGAPHGDGTLEIWAGGLEGKIRVWRNTHHQEGPQQPVSEWQAHEDAVTGTIVHRSGGVVASCSGQRHHETSAYIPLEDSSDSSSGPREGRGMISDNSLKIWSV